MSKIFISTWKYEATHGKKPKGNSGWVFNFPEAPTRHQFITFGTYSQACKSATAEARQRGFQRIEVLP